MGINGRHDVGSGQFGDARKTPHAAPRFVSFRTDRFRNRRLGDGPVRRLSFGDGDNDPGTFDPTVTFETSTTRATAHPDARITIDNSGNTADVGSVSISLPDGFWGSLASINSKCQNFTVGSGSDGSDDCVAGDSKVGTVKATATIDQSEATLTGDVYIVESTNPDVAAYLGIKVHAKVGGVDMGYVRVLGSAAIRGNAIGMDTVFENLPNSITQTSGPNSRTVDFHLEKMTVDLKSDLDGPNQPLLTNPSKCGSSDFIATLGSGATLGGLDDVQIIQPYTVDGCEDAKFAPSNFAFTATDPNASQTTGFTATIDMPGDSASMSGIAVKLRPRSASTSRASVTDGHVRRRGRSRRGLDIRPVLLPGAGSRIRDAVHTLARWGRNRRRVPDQQDAEPMDRY